MRKRKLEALMNNTKNNKEREKRKVSYGRRDERERKMNTKSARLHKEEGVEETKKTKELIKKKGKGRE